MTKAQLKKCPNFSAQEIIIANGDLAGINARSFYKLQAFRTNIGRPVKFQFNGINSGDHVSQEHPDGKAFDIFVVWNKPQSFDILKGWVYIAIECGFNGIGVYWNEVMYSLHLDDGRVRRWIGHKNTGQAGYKYGSFINDPRLLGE